MTENTLEKNLETAYGQVFYTMLMDSISKNDKFDFSSLCEKNRNDIGRQASNEANKLAKGFVSEMRKRGYLETMPGEKELEELLNEYLTKVKHV